MLLANDGGLLLHKLYKYLEKEETLSCLNRRISERYMLEILLSTCKYDKYLDLSPKCYKYPCDMQNRGKKGLRSWMLSISRRYNDSRTWVVHCRHVSWPDTPTVIWGAECFWCTRYERYYYIIASKLPIVLQNDQVLSYWCNADRKQRTDF